MHSDRLIQSIRHLVESTGMLPAGMTVLVAVSGGQDSCALLHGLALLSGEFGIRLHAAHFNHQIRGEESNADEEFVRLFAESLSVPFHRGSGDVKSSARRLHVSLQEAARRARHGFLEKTAAEIGASRIALGHTRDDHIETVLLNIIRGTGIDGLGGLRPVQGNRIRPLLEVSREETSSYCRRHSIRFREDASNQSLKYLRNRVRKELLPMLGSYYNPAIREALVRLSEIAGDESDLLNGLASTALESSIVNRERGLLVLCTERLALLDRAQLRRVVRTGIGEVRGSLADIEAEQVESIVGAVLDGSDTCIRLPRSDVQVRTGQGQLRIERLEPAVSMRHVRRELTVPGRSIVPELRLELVAESAASWDALSQFDFTLVVDAERIRLPLMVRTWVPGDRIRPIGMAGDKKLQDIFVDRKTAVSKRHRVPIIEDAEGIIWVVGHAVAERVRPLGGTKQALRLEVRDLE